MNAYMISAKKKRMTKRMTVQDYLNEEIVVGGEKMTRGQFILDMKAQGATQKQIDFYMMGLEQVNRVEEVKT